MDKNINIKPYRHELINAFYHYLLMNKNSDQIKQDILDQNQIEIKDDKVEEAALELADSYNDIIEEIKPLFKEGWTWDRLPILIQSILIVGTWEIENTDIEKGITINEMVNYTKKMDPNFNYQFVNAILDKANKK